MGFDDLCGGEAGVAGDLGEVWAVINDVDLDVRRGFARVIRRGVRGDRQVA